MNNDELSAEISILRAALQEANSQRDTANASVARVRELAIKFIEWKGAPDPIAPLHGAGMARGFQFAGKEILEIIGDGKS